jgi:hypothetical protein
MTEQFEPITFFKIPALTLDTTCLLARIDSSFRNLAPFSPEAALHCIFDVLPVDCEHGEDDQEERLRQISRGRAEQELLVPHDPRAQCHPGPPK